MFLVVWSFGWFVLIVGLVVLCYCVISCGVGLFDLWFCCCDLVALRSGCFMLLALRCVAWFALFRVWMRVALVYVNSVGHFY